MAETDHSRLETIFKIAFGVVVLLIIVTASVQVGFVRAGNQRTSDIKANQDEILVSQDQADRNLAVQACTSRYAATATAWEERADNYEAQIIRNALLELPLDRSLSDRSVEATDNAHELTRRRIGLADLAQDEATDRSNGFACPAIPERLEVAPLDPTDPSDPSP